MLINKVGGWNKLSENEIKVIIKTYLEIKSIERTAKMLNYAKNTVNKYVKDYSIKDKRSRYNNIAVYKINSDGKIVRTFKNSNMASKLCHISLSNLNQCLNCRTNSAGGFCWCYANRYVGFKLPVRIHESYVRQEDILLSLK